MNKVKQTFSCKSKSQFDVLNIHFCQRIPLFVVREKCFLNVRNLNVM